jgi:hypothetical protein
VRVYGVRHLQQGDGSSHLLGDLAGTGTIGVRQDDGELTAAVAGNEVAGPPHGRLDCLHHPLQARIARLMAVMIVVFLNQSTSIGSSPIGVSSRAARRCFRTSVASNSRRFAHPGQPVGTGERLEFGFCGRDLPELV